MIIGDTFGDLTGSGNAAGGCHITESVTIGGRTARRGAACCIGIGNTGRESTVGMMVGGALRDFADAIAFTGGFG